MLCPAEASISISCVQPALLMFVYFKGLVPYFPVFQSSSPLNLVPRVSLEQNTPLFPSHSPVSASADSVSNALRHFEFKFGLSAWSVVFSSCTPQRQSSFATHPPPLVEVDRAPTCSYPRCMPSASSVADSSHNLILCDEVMSM